MQLCLGASPLKDAHGRCDICLAVFATTAANAEESSYACYYDKKRDTYLGDWYSVNWMEDSDEARTSFEANFSNSLRQNSVLFSFDRKSVQI